MKKFDLDISLPENPVNTRKVGDHLTVNDLSQKSIDYINAFYKKDFVSFGYQFLRGSEYASLRTGRKK